MARAPSPTARALLALELLQAAPGITADRLAERLGVTERAARRYVGILREAGIPIDSVRGPRGGYRVGRGLRLPPLTFGADEALGLVMAVLDGHHAAGDPGRPKAPPIRSARLSARSCGRYRRRSPQPPRPSGESRPPAPDRAAARPDPATTAVLVQACADHRKVRLDYRSEAGSQWSAEVDPWAVVVRHGRWYLLCRSAGEVRAYRVDRVGDVSVLDEIVDVPADLDPVTLLEDHLAVGWEYRVELIVDAPAEVVAAIPTAGHGQGRGDRRGHRTSDRYDRQSVLVRGTADVTAGRVPHRRGS